MSSSGVAWFRVRSTVSSDCSMRGALTELAEGSEQANTTKASKLETRRILPCGDIRRDNDLAVYRRAPRGRQHRLVGPRFSNIAFHLRLTFLRESSTRPPRIVDLPRRDFGSPALSRVCRKTGRASVHVPALDGHEPDLIASRVPSARTA